MSKQGSKNSPNTPKRDQNINKIDKSGGTSKRSEGQIPASKNPTRPPKK